MILKANVRNVPSSSLKMRAWVGEGQSFQPHVLGACTLRTWQSMPPTHFATNNAALQAQAPCVYIGSVCYT
jgi:hypothetical protein